MYRAMEGGARSLTTVWVLFKAAVLLIFRLRSVFSSDILAEFRYIWKTYEFGKPRNERRPVFHGCAKLVSMPETNDWQFCTICMLFFTDSFDFFGTQHSTWMIMHAQSFKNWGSIFTFGFDTSWHHGFAPGYFRARFPKT